MKSKKIYICGAVLLVSLLLSASAWGYEKEIESLASAAAEKIASKGNKAVAVVDFTDFEGNVTQLDRFIAEQFSVALAGAGKGFRVIDRGNLNSIIKEHNLSKTGLLDQETAMKLGKIAGVDTLVTGTLISFSDNVSIVIKVIDIETAEIVSALKASIAKTTTIEELLNFPFEGNSFFDDFENGRQDGWRTINGKWTVENGRYTVTDIKREEEYISLIKNRILGSFIFSVDVSPGYISRSLYKASVCPRIIDSDSMICFALEGKKNRFYKSYWYIVKKGVNSDHVGSMDIETVEGQSVPVRIKIINGVFTAYVNNVKASQIYDLSFASGSAGLAQKYELWNYDKIKMTFDNVSIIPISN